MAIDDDLDLHVRDGSAVLNIGPGYVVAKTADLVLDIGKATGADNSGDMNNVSFTDADVLSSP